MHTNWIFCAIVASSCIFLAASALEIPIPTATNNFLLSYEIDIENETVTLEMIGVTSGYVAFGFTNISGMVQSDIFLGGVYANGTSYFGDYTSYQAGPPGRDAQQNWELLDATEESGVTTVRFSREWNTGDPVDIVISDKLMNIVWALGPANDAFQYHGFPRSSLKYNLVSNTNGGEEPIPPPGF